MFSQNLLSRELLLAILAHEPQQPKMLHLDMPLKVRLLVVAPVAPKVHAVVEYMELGGGVFHTAEIMSEY